MSKKILFSYKIENNGGDLVFTIGGLAASNIVGSLEQESPQKSILEISKLVPFNRLASAPVNILGAFKNDRGHIEHTNAEPLDMAQIFGQGFDSDFGGFEQKLSEYRQLLAFQGDTKKKKKKRKKKK